MKSLPVPQELEHYRHDHGLESRIKVLPRTLGVFSLFVLLLTVSLFVAKRPDWGMGSFVVLLAALALWGYVSNIKKRRIACRLCAKQMAVVDSVLPEEQLGKFERKWMNKSLAGDGKSLFKGADGNIYEINWGSSARVLLSKHTLRWYVCHDCTRYCSAGRAFTWIRQDNESQIEALKKQLVTEGETAEVFEE